MDVGELSKAGTELNWISWRRRRAGVLNSGEVLKEVGKCVCVCVCCSLLLADVAGCGKAVRFLCGGRRGLKKKRYLTFYGIRLAIELGVRALPSRSRMLLGILKALRITK
jgi:hypothetical protein